MKLTYKDIIDANSFAKKMRPFIIEAIQEMEQDNMKLTHEDLVSAELSFYAGLDSGLGLEYVGMDEMAEILAVSEEDYHAASREALLIPLD